VCEGWREGEGEGERSGDVDACEGEDGDESSCCWKGRGRVLLCAVVGSLTERRWLSAGDDTCSPERLADAEGDARTGAAVARSGGGLERQVTNAYEEGRIDASRSSSSSPASLLLLLLLRAFAAGGTCGCCAASSSSSSLCTPSSSIAGTLVRPMVPVVGGDVDDASRASGDGETGCNGRGALDLALARCGAWKIIPTAAAPVVGLLLLVGDVGGAARKSISIGLREVAPDGLEWL
jgi:hypothetical protein